MILKLTDEMREALRGTAGQALKIEDDQTHQQYVLVPLSIYQRIAALLVDEPFDVTDTYAAQSAVAGVSGWVDPEMDVYDNYDSNKPAP